MNALTDRAARTNCQLCGTRKTLKVPPLQPVCPHCDRPCDDPYCGLDPCDYKRKRIA